MGAKLSARTSRCGALFSGETKEEDDSGERTGPTSSIWAGSHPGDRSALTTAVLETEKRVIDDGSARERRDVARLARAIALAAADAAVACAFDDDARARLESRCEVARGCAELGATDYLPLAFGRPEKGGKPSSSSGRNGGKRKRRKVAGTTAPPPKVAERKYWVQRYRLFSAYDDGVRLDAESFYSATPELVAKAIADRCRGLRVLDAFAGAGGNAIQFAAASSSSSSESESEASVVAIEIDASKVADARHNAALYGVLDGIDFREGDAVAFLLREAESSSSSSSSSSHRPFDVVFLSPPWGGLHAGQSVAVQKGDLLSFKDLVLRPSLILPYLALPLSCFCKGHFCHKEGSFDTNAAGPDYASHPRGYFDPAADVTVRSPTHGDVDGVALARLAANAAPNLIYYLPKTTPLDQARQLADAFLDARRRCVFLRREAAAASSSSTCMKHHCFSSSSSSVFFGRLSHSPHSSSSRVVVELESNFLNDRLKAKTLYVGPHFVASPP